MDSQSQTLLEHLENATILSPSVLEGAKTVARDRATTLDRAILQAGLLEEAQLLNEVELANGITRANAEHLTHIDTDLVHRVGHGHFRQIRAIPVVLDESHNLITDRPLDKQFLRETSFFLGHDFAPLSATAAQLDEWLEQISEPKSEDIAAKPVQPAHTNETAGPITDFVRRMLIKAVDSNASDIHVSSRAGDLKVRMRVGGNLERLSIDDNLDPQGVIARFKVMAKMNVAERRLPQDGRIDLQVSGRAIDFRVSCLPTEAGESVVCRILDPLNIEKNWDDLGFYPDIQRQLINLIEKPHGLFLVTGPTGSGKTTTLYTALRHLNAPNRKLLTVEDPVEYQLQGVEQVQVNETVGLTFPVVLRSMLRQDPNVLMVGEIRDQETAQIACRAALVGRLVLSTLHVSSPELALPRLTDLGVEQYVVEDVLVGVLGQALVPGEDCVNLSTSLWIP